MNAIRKCFRLFMKSRSIPALAVLTVNNRCDSHCPYCFVERAPCPDVPIEKLRRVIDELGALGCFEVTVQGGEAMLRDDIGEIFSHIKSRNMRLHLVTNGKSVRNRLEEIRMLDAAHISLEGDREFTNAAKNDPDYFDGAMEGIRLLREAGVHCTINAILLKGVSEQIGFLMELAREHGMGVQFLSPISTHSAKLNRKFLIDDEEFEKAVGLIIEAKRRGDPVLPSVRGLRKALRWKEKYNQAYSQIDRVSDAPLPRNPCFAGRKFVFIDYRGYLSPCCILRTEDANVYELGVERAMKIAAEKNLCYDCINPPFIDMNMIFSHDIRTLMNYLVRMSRYR